MVPRPVGRQMLLYGDKVINVINQRRRDVWPKPAGDAYVANGDIGIVVGQYNPGTRPKRADEFPSDPLVDERTGPTPVTVGRMGKPRPVSVLR